MMSSTDRRPAPFDTSKPTVIDPLMKRAIAEARQFGAGPVATVRCQGAPRFRTQLARDLGCLFDVDPDVEAWECLPGAVTLAGTTGKRRRHVPDFRVSRSDGSTVLMDTIPASGSKGGIAGLHAIDLLDERYEQASEVDIRTEPRLSNARELLRYAGVQVSLSDRIRFLAMLDEYGPTPISECLRGCRGSTDPIAMIAVLTLRRFIDMDLDEAPIGPETVIRRLRD